MAAFGASGFGGQQLAIDPERDLVVLFRVDTGRSISSFVWWYLFGDQLNDSDLIDFLQEVLSAGGQGTFTG